ncbi:MAG: hypothetical protein IPG45_29710 [Deltaproteobacteria bacterium]|nr:hypothetical protein [Deltaproteobacteria bacterium]
MKSTSFALCSLGSLLLATSAWASTGQLVVPTFQVSSVDPNVAPILTELVLESLLTRHGLHALGPSDVQDLLVTEQTRQSMGCETSCMKELAGALGASKLVSGSVGRLGDVFVLTLKLVDVESAQVLSRASRNFAKLEGAKEVVGPLVDELLGAPARASVDAPKLIGARKEAEKQRPVATVTTFCSATVEAYTQALLSGDEPGRLVQARRGLLEDLLLTPFLAEVQQKIRCLEAKKAGLQSGLADRRVAANSPEAHERIVRAEAEWAELEANLPLLLEAYKNGVDKEQRGTGARPVELPFVVRAPKAQAAPEDQAAKVEHEAGAVILSKALAAVERSDKPAFVAQFAEPGPKGRAPARDLYVTTLALSERYRLDPCPWHLLSAEDRAARRVHRQKTGRTKICLRLVAREDGKARLEDVEIIASPSGPKIHDWRPSD